MKGVLMVKFLVLFLVGSLSVGIAHAGLSNKQIDQVIELLMAETDVTDYMFGDDGEDCLSDIDVHSTEQLASKEWTIEFNILHLEKQGCVHWTSIACKANLTEDLSKITNSSCSY